MTQYPVEIGFDPLGRIVLSRRDRVSVTWLRLNQCRPYAWQGTWGTGTWQEHDPPGPRYTFEWTLSWTYYEFDPIGWLQPPISGPRFRYSIDCVKRTDGSTRSRFPPSRRRIQQAGRRLLLAAEPTPRFRQLAVIQLLGLELWYSYPFRQQRDRIRALQMQLASLDPGTFAAQLAARRHEASMMCNALRMLGGANVSWDGYTLSDDPWELVHAITYLGRGADNFSGMGDPVAYLAKARPLPWRELPADVLEMGDA